MYRYAVSWRAGTDGARDEELALILEVAYRRANASVRVPGELVVWPSRSSATAGKAPW